LGHDRHLNGPKVPALRVRDNRRDWRERHLESAARHSHMLCRCRLLSSISSGGSHSGDYNGGQEPVVCRAATGR
jgi:hypothetical protein